ncbi:sensor histidine kinase [Anaerobium acetethylicum]|uniref:Two-component system, sensor histidine kinase YesM n=1 Tax=Anaerobium acetethylicum TaxID=1619234 RepID=A0A1D3TY46_9FIRM|nr:histidine kinase [Anaerobium acetethylicum]SCP99311.1 two-component system, sensor histidine kinase YesM [Anaerobium acetethylicum]
MQQLKLQTKLFLAYVGLAVLILSAFSVFFYKFVSKQLISQEIDSITTLNASFEDQVDSVVRDMDTVSININYSSLVKDKLGSSFNLDISKDTLDNMASLFVTINGADVKVDQINLYDMQDHMLKVGIQTNTSSVKTDSLAWFTEVLNLGGKKMISQPYLTSSLSTSSRYPVWYISLYRSYDNKYGKTVGAVETIKRCKSIFKSILSYEKKASNSAKVYIYSEDHKLIYPYNLTQEEQTSIPDYYSYMTDTKDSASLKNPVTGEKEYIAYTTSSFSRWTYITVQPESYVLKPVNNLLYILLLFVFALLAASLIISYGISRSLVKPIKHLKHIVQRLEIDTLGETYTGSYHVAYNEMQELYHAFQNMSENLNTSMNALIDSRQQELKSRTLALQSQINPHFYYNTLSSIIVLAENGQPQEVITMCRNLTKIMRYITDSSSTSVSIRSEIDYVNKYLYCMKVRYQSSLNYTIDIDESLLDRQIPKLLIQPIVENALKYGTDCIPPWNLSVTGHICDTHWQIDVIDSGNGFSESAVRTITERIQEADANPGMPEMKINGLGMINVYMRWKLYCEDEIIFSYGNTKDGHGIVSVGQKFKKKEN